MTPEQSTLIERYKATAPVDVLGLAKGLGLAVYTSDFDNGLSGVLRPSRLGKSGYIVLVNSKHPENRKRFTIAHEIGHFVLHANRIGAGIEDDEFYRALPGPLETEANRFAADLLMPWALIGRLQDSGITSLPMLAKRLAVSQQALAIRLGLPYDQTWE